MLPSFPRRVIHAVSATHVTGDGQYCTCGKCTSACITIVNCLTIGKRPPPSTFGGRPLIAAGRLLLCCFSLSASSARTAPSTKR